MTKENKHIRYLKSINACSNSILFAEKFDSMQEVWNACDRPDWLFWLIGKQAQGRDTESRKRIVFVAAQCARTALKYTKDPRVLNCILSCEAYYRNEQTFDELVSARRAAADAAADAADAADAHAAAAAAAAADAADAAYAHAAAAAVDYAAYAAAADAREVCLKECAQIIKRYYPKIRMGKWVTK